MQMKTVRAALLFVAAMAVAIAAVAQEGHPTTGTWYGDYTSGTQKNDLTVIMKWDGKAISGLINPGPNSKPITSATMDITPGKPAPQGQQSTQGVPPIFTVRFEADGMTFEGTIKNPVAVNRQIVGTWSRGAEKGTFQIRRL
jgi:opacity protein-like surface antigen